MAMSPRVIVPGPGFSGIAVGGYGFTLSPNRPFKEHQTMTATEEQTVEMTLENRLPELFAQGPEWAKDEGIGIEAHGIRHVVGKLRDVLSDNYLAHHNVPANVSEMRDVDELIREVVYARQELHHLLTDQVFERIVPVWRVSKWTKLGVICRSEGKPATGEERDTHPVEPLWWVKLSLPAWILSSHTQRLRILHHALMMCDTHVNEETGAITPRKRHPSVVAFPETVDAFGPGGRAQAHFVAAANHHPTTVATLALYHFDQEDQGLLFGAYKALSDGQRAKLEDDREKARAARDGDDIPEETIQNPDGFVGPQAITDYVNTCGELASDLLHQPDECEKAGDWVDTLTGLRDKAQADGAVSPSMRGDLRDVQKAFDAWRKAFVERSQQLPAPE